MNKTRRVTLPRQTKPAGFNVDFSLDYRHALALVRLIRAREDDIRKVTPDCPNYEVMNELAIELGVLKDLFAAQMPSIGEAEAKIAELAQ